jgi:hypothetical protein
MDRWVSEAPGMPLASEGFIPHPQAIELPMRSSAVPMKKLKRARERQQHLLRAIA